MKKARVRASVESLLPIATGFVASKGELRFFLDSDCIWKRSVSPEQAREFYEALTGEKP